MGINNKKILIVDDDARYQRLLGIFFKNIGFEPFATASPVDAIAFAIKHNPLMITVDYILPQMYGDIMLDVLKSVDQTKDILTLVISSEISKDFLSKAKVHGVNGFVSKPFQMNVLFDKLKVIFDGVDPEILKQAKLEDSSSNLNKGSAKAKENTVTSYKEHLKNKDATPQSSPKSGNDNKDMGFKVFEL